MAGSWELAERRQVLVGILHTETTTLAWSFGLRNLIVPGEIVPAAGMPYDHARNSLAMACLQNKFEWLFFLDSDVIPPHDAILRLMAHKQPIMSGLYFRRSPPHGVPVMMRGGQWITQFTPGSIVEADVVGAGCLLIHRTVLERLPPSDPNRGKLWFNWKVDQNGVPGVEPGTAMSEDYTFCLECRRRLGLKILIDTSILCRHAGYGEAIQGGMQPLNTSPKT